MRNLIFSLILIQGIFCGNVGWGDWMSWMGGSGHQVQPKEPLESDLTPEQKAGIVRQMGDVALSAEDRERLMAKYPETAEQFKAVDSGRAPSDLTPFTEAADKAGGDVELNDQQKEQVEKNFKTSVETMEEADVDTALKALKGTDTKGFSSSKLDLYQKFTKILEEKQAKQKAAGSNSATAAKTGSPSAGAEANKGLKQVPGNFAIGKDGKRYPIYDVEGKRISAAPNDPGALIVEDLKTGQIGYFMASQLGFKREDDGTLTRTDAPQLENGTQVAQAVFVNGKPQDTWQNSGSTYYGENKYSGSSPVVEQVGKTDMPKFTQETTRTSASTDMRPSNLGNIFFQTSQGSSSRETASVPEGGTTSTASTPTSRSTVRNTPAAPSGRAPCFGSGCQTSGLAESGYHIGPIPQDTCPNGACGG